MRAMTDTTQKKSGPGKIIAIVAGVIVLSGVCCGCLGVVSAVAIPSFVSYQEASEMSSYMERYTVESHVDSISSMMGLHKAISGEAIACGSESEALAFINSGGGPEEAKEWDPSAMGGDCWETLDWDPYGEVPGGYWVELDGEGFTVWGVSDLDGDGEIARVKATEDDYAEWVTDDDVY